jgi:competence protein ComEA
VPDPPARSQLILYVAAAVVVAVLAVRWLTRTPSPAALAPATAPVRVERAAPSPVLVHVAGAVRRPGVYRLRAGARIDDAVARAGGPTARADLGAVNLAAKVEDGRQVVVPERPPRGGAAAGAPPPGGAGAAAGAPGAGTAGAGGAGGGAAAGGAGPGVPLNLNTATLEQLQTLAGVGPATAQKILEYREQHGGFGTVEDLANVPGIGEKRLASLREQVTV